MVDLKGHLWVNLEDSSAVVELDTRSLKVLAHWPLAPGEEPTGLAIDRDSRRLFSSCSNQKLVVLDADKGKVVAVLPIGAGVDGAAFDPGRKLVYTSNGEGTLSVFHEDGHPRLGEDHDIRGEHLVRRGATGLLGSCK